MVKIIETNLSMKINEIMDLQSRVIEVESWESYIEEFKCGKSISRYCCVGSLWGNTLPRESRIENLIITDRTLSCDVYSFKGFKTRKLAYLV